MDRSQVVSELREKILDEHARLHHPLIKAILAGEIDRTQLAGFAREFWVIPHTHLINNGGKLAHGQLMRGSWLQQLLTSRYDQELVHLLGESLADELGKTEISPINHYDCYFDFTDELGIPREEIGNPLTLSPMSLVTMHTWASSALSFSLLELLGSHNLVNDTASVVALPKFCKALREHYHLSEKAITWFNLHGEVDVEHGSRAGEIIISLMKNEEDEHLLRIAVQFGLGVLWTLFDGIMDTYVTGAYPRKTAAARAS